MNVNILLYSNFYNILNDENSNVDMNKSLSRKLLYKECHLIPYDLYINKNIINKNDSNILDKNSFKLFKTENYELKYVFI